LAGCVGSGESWGMQLGEVPEQGQGASWFECRRLFFLTVQCDNFMAGVGKVFYEALSDLSFWADEENY
ncbi:hypothetical protein, partial [Pseudomonas syringae group genomosp. 7]|uniref:hypothetical protein n=1 Tax=Pseudomonas syringae group genomosp. 7 TaxID=251699 RepID=UPI0037703668